MLLPLRGGVKDRSLPRVPPFFPAHDAHDEKAGEKAEEKEQARGEPAVARRLIVPAGLVISFLIHLAFLTPAFILAGGSPFDAPPAEAITVDIVTPGEVPSPPEEPPPDEKPAKEKPTFDIPSLLPSAPPPPQATPEKPAAQQQAPATPEKPATQQQAPAATPAQSAKASAAPPPDPGRTREATASQTAQEAVPQTPLPSVLPPVPFMQQQPQAPQSAEPPIDQSTMFGMPMTMPDGTVGGRTFDSEAVDRANIANDAVAAFRAHLKTCSKLPPGVSREVRVVVRIYLKPDGTLAAGLPANPEPIKVEGVSAGGGALYQNAVAALRKCQPYRMLPPDRYREWRTLDLTFTPQNF